MGDPITDADIERAREGYRRFREGDPSFLEDWDPDAEIEMPKRLPGGGKLHGVHELIEFFAGVAERFEDAHPEPEEFLAAGDKLIVLGTWHGRARHTGRAVAAPFAHLYEIRNGKVVYHRNYLDSAEVLVALEEQAE